MRINDLKPLVITPISSAPETVNSSTDHGNLVFNQSELLSSHFNKYKCKQPQKTQTQAQTPTPTPTPKSSSNDNAIPSTSNAIPIKKIASNEKQSNKIQSNRASNPLFDQKPSVFKQKAPSNEVAPSSSLSLSKNGAGTTIPIVQNIQEHNL